MSLVIETTLGDLEVDLYIRRCPTICYNFIKLCKIKYYNSCVFYSIQKNFVAQTGDPSGVGKGGSSIFGIIDNVERRYFKEDEKQSSFKHTKPGLLSMVNCGGDMFGSQFLITLGNSLHSLDGEHIVFGEVVQGSNILHKFNEVITDSLHRPYKDVIVTHTVVVDDPFEDPRRMLVPSRSPSPNEEAIKNLHPDPVENDTSEETETEKLEKVKEKEARAQATILEMIGDLPSYDVTPPENILFVCHLNPVTTEEDLEIIFNRFGTIKCVEVIRDRKTGDSLQYAFVEFEDKRACEEASLRMEGALIDERRIHVDFSQSVAKHTQWNRTVTVSCRDDQKEEPSARKVTPHTQDSVISSRNKPEGDMPSTVKYDEQQSAKGVYRKESRRDDERRTSRKHDSRRRNPFGCSRSCRKCSKNSYPRGYGKERKQDNSKSGEEEPHGKQMRCCSSSKCSQKGDCYEYVQEDTERRRHVSDKTERKSCKCASSQGKGRKSHSRLIESKRAGPGKCYHDESENKECRYTRTYKKQKKHDSHSDGFSSEEIYKTEKKQKKRKK